MPTYAFEARNELGVRIRGQESAPDEVALDGCLASRGLLLVAARPASRQRRRAGRVRQRTLIDFCHHMATVVETGIPMLTGLRDLQEDGKSPIAAVLEDVARKVEAGQRLSSALASHPDLFPDLLFSLVAAGEESGTLDAILRDLVVYLEWREELRRKLVSAATYPCLVLLGMLGLGLLLATVVLPSFLATFVELRVALPLPTRVLLAIQGAVEAHGAQALLATALAITALWLALRSESARLRFDATLLQLPVLGPILTMIEMSRLSHNLAVLHSAGIPILRGLELVHKIIQNRVIRALILHGREQIERGETLSGAFAASPLLPPLVKRTLSLGETTGRLDDALEHVSRYYEREVPARVDAALVLFNTGIVVALGLMLGTVAFSIFVPLYQMMGSING